MLLPDKEKELVNELLSKMIELWPQCKIAKSGARHEQSKGALKANADFKKYCFR
jgi:hypothetical protein